ncbi:MAG: CpaF family protein [Lachnospiraceae bacterium]|nr:CpaF family protein [Lachnospiraceae bacterium]
MMHQPEACRKKIRDEVFHVLDPGRDTSDEEMYALIDRSMAQNTYVRQMSVAQRRMIRRDVFASIRELDVLQPLLDDPEVTEIMVNGPEHIFVEREGRLMKHEAAFSSAQKLEDVIQQIVAGCNRVVNESSPIVDARLADGSRVNIVLRTIALNGPVITIRRFPKERITMEHLIRFGSVTKELCAYLRILVRAGYNIFIAGGTGSGKTTFLNALSDHIPEDARVITVEDNAELQITHIPNLVRMEARNANVEGCREITIRDLIKSSLRMRPDRIVVGEVRGDEAIDMVQAMNTGHDGSMSTGHANSTVDMLARLETMILMGMDLPLSAVRRQLAAGIDIIVHLGRLRDRTRKLLEISEVTGYVDAASGEIETKPLFRFRETGTGSDHRITGRWEKVHALQNTQKLEAAGLVLPDL